MKQHKQLIIFAFLIASALFFYQADCRGKTYDDLDDILKHDNMTSRANHVAYHQAIEEGSKIDKTKVVHVSKPDIQEEKAVTSGYVMTKAHQKVKKPSNETKSYQQHAATKSEFDSNDLFPLKYLKIPKRDRDAQFYFFLSTLLLLATTVTIISSCGCLFYFLLKNLITMQQRIVNADDEVDNNNDQFGVQERRDAGPASRNDQFQQFHDEEDNQQQQNQASDGESRLRRLNYRDAYNSSQNSVKE